MKFISKEHVSDFSRFALYITNLLSLSSLVELKDVAQNVGRLRLIVSNVLILLRVTMKIKNQTIMYIC